VDLHVDRLTLRLASVSEADARRLGRLVVEYLASASATGAMLNTDRIRVSVAPHPGESLDSMAQRIAAEMAYALARST
jgi:hypothetical protein